MCHSICSTTCFVQTLFKNISVSDIATVSFQASTPTQMYLSSHTFGAYYTYDPHRHEFLYTGEDFREGIPMSPNFPGTVQLTGFHPVLYAAQGSHGLWGSTGKFLLHFSFAFQMKTFIALYKKSISIFIF